MRPMHSCVAAILAVSVLAGCGEDHDSGPWGNDGGSGGRDGAGGDGGGPGGSGGEAGGEGGSSIGPIEWSACPPDVPFRCAEIDVPLDWSDSTSERISIFVRKYEARSSQARGQLWLLEGGPGASGEGLTFLAPEFAALGFDVYLPDYRGVGRSTPLACEGDDWRLSWTCKREIQDRFGTDLRFFSTTAAAMDIGKTIEAIRGQGENVFIYGVSYGTFLGNRFLTLFPDLADGAILDSICPATGCNIHQDLNLNIVAKRVLDRCGQDAACRKRLSADPWEKLGRLQRRFADGHCPDFAGPRGAHALSQIFAATVTRRWGAPIALAATYRLDRCSADDVVAARILLDELMPGMFAMADEAPFSEFLYQMIFLSEFWEEGLTKEALGEEISDLYLIPGYGYSLIMMRDGWTAPSYETPKSFLRWADVSIPMLLLNGTLDAQTPEWDLAGIEEAFSRPHQTYVEVPFGGHGSILEGEAPGGLGTCGFRMIAEFLLDPSGAVDTSCLADLEVLDLSGDGIPAPEVFGTADLWENGSRSLSAHAVRAMAPAERYLERARREAAGLRPR